MRYSYSKTAQKSKNPKPTLLMVFRNLTNSKVQFFSFYLVKTLINLVAVTIQLLPSSLTVFVKL